MPGKQGQKLGRIWNGRYDKTAVQAKNARQPQSDEKEWNGDKKLRGKG